jgi:hypothetical protein
MERLRIPIRRVYLPLITDTQDERFKLVLMYSPRSAGKSTALAQIIYKYYCEFPEYDICIGVDSMTNAGDGVFAEFQSFIENNDLNQSGEWVFASQTIYNKKQVNQIRAYAVQTNELRNVNVTKSKKLIRNVSLFVMDEVQKLHSLEILLNAKSTFMRQLKAGHSKVIFAGNPDRRAMWFHDYFKSCQKDPEYTVLRPTYLDIIDCLHPALLHEIENLKKTNPVEYEKIYMGNLDATGWDTVFHSFRRDKHYIKRRRLIEDDAKGITRDSYLSRIVIGVDDAERQDALAASCITVRGDGIMRVQESLYLSCKELEVKPALTERCQIVIKFLDYIHKWFNPDRIIPVVFSFDCAGGMYQQMCVIKSTDKEFMRWRNVQLFPYTSKQEKEEQLGKVNSAFAENILAVVDVNEHSPQYSNDKLVEQVMALMLLDNGKIDPKIPNDCTDALQYGAMMVLQNPYNLSLPTRLSQFRVDERNYRKQTYM